MPLTPGLTHALLDGLALLSPFSLAATALLVHAGRRRRRATAARTAELERRITRLEHERADLERTSVTDPLTGVWNYRYLQLSLDREVARGLRGGRPLAVLLLGVDGLAALRHQAGHQRANALLRDLAQRLAVEIRQSDTFGRYDGEEFLVLLPDTDAAGAAQVAERLCWTVRRHRPEPALPAGHRLTAAVGAAVLPADGDHTATLLRAADRALAAAREAGGDTWRTASTAPGPAVRHLRRAPGIGSGGAA